MRRTATRAAGDGTAVAVDEQRAALIRRVSMDMLTVDLTDLTSARIGSEVELWGPNTPVAHIVVSAGTIAYKLLCNAARHRAEASRGQRGRMTSWLEVVSEGLAFVFVQRRGSGMTSRSGRLPQAQAAELGASPDFDWHNGAFAHNNEGRNNRRMTRWLRRPPP